MTYFKLKESDVRFNNNKNSANRHMPSDLESQIRLIWSDIEMHFEGGILAKPTKNPPFYTKVRYCEYLSGKHLHALAYFAFFADTVNSKDGKERAFSMYREWLLEGERMTMLNKGSNESLKGVLIEDILNDRFNHLG